MPLVIPGHGFLITRYPSSTDLPWSSKISTSNPGTGTPTDVGTLSRNGSILRIAPPTSVPPDKFITGQRLFPIFEKYQFHASLFNLSPVETSSLREEK